MIALSPFILIGLCVMVILACKDIVIRFISVITIGYLIFNIIKYWNILGEK